MSTRVARRPRRVSERTAGRGGGEAGGGDCLSLHLQPQGSSLVAQTGRLEPPNQVQRNSMLAPNADSIGPGTVRAVPGPVHRGGRWPSRYELWA